MPKAITNLTKIVKQLRAAGGAQLQIIGSTYPDVELGLRVDPTVLGANTLALVPGSISAFLDVINPGLKKAYDSVGAAFADVTKATGAYGPFVATNGPMFGQIPVRRRGLHLDLLLRRHFQHPHEDPRLPHHRCAGGSDAAEV